jgi:preprotein translocase subunit SecD
MESPPKRSYFYVFPRQPDLTTADFDLGASRQDFDSATGEPIVLLRFSKEGEGAFRELTRRLARRGSTTEMAIVVDDELVSAPTFDPTITSEGLYSSTGIQISGLASLEDARALAQVLRLSDDRASATEMEH